jgi:hypothetical protein
VALEVTDMALSSLNGRSIESMLSVALLSVIRVAGT